MAKHTVDRTELVPLEQIALARFKPDKSARDEVAPGEYEGRIRLDVKYAIKVGEDYVGTHPVSIPWQAMVAVLLSKVNDATAASVLREALDGNIDTSEVKAEAEAAIATLVDRTEKVFRGKVTGTTTILRATST